MTRAGAGQGGLVLVCPAGCRRRRAVGHPVCSACWHLVPAPVRVEVRRTWAALQRDARPEAFAAYAAAATRAVNTAVAIRELSKPGPPALRRVAR